MKVFYAPEFECIYMWDEENKTLVMTYPGNGDSGVTELFPPEVDVIGDEPVTFRGKETTFAAVYKIIERELRN